MKRLISIGAALVGVVVLTACGTSSGSDNPTIAINSPATQGFTGTTFQPARLLPEVTLTDTAGKPWNLVQHGQGKVTVLFFGYTHCPDVCPTDMAAIGAAVRKLTSDEQKKIQVVFVTVDPKRDTPSRLREWLDRFDKNDPQFVGLTGTNATLTEAAHKLGMQFDVTSKPGGLEEVEHSAQMTAFDMSGTANLAWLDPLVPTDIAHDLRLLISGVTPA